jgi:hypothetical protein
MERDILRQSKGITVKPGDRIFVRYEGKLTNGNVFDGNFEFSSLEAVPGRDAFSFVLGQNQVIAGWELGLKGAKLGQVIRLVIPPELAYGAAERPGIPPNSTLDFTVEVLGYSRGDQSSPETYKLEDIGISLAKYGLKENSLKRVSSGKIGLDVDENIIGTDGVDFLTGLGGKNVITGGLAGDVLIATRGTDIFEYSFVSDSLPGKGSRDFIGGFNKNDRIDISALSEEQTFTYVGADKFSGAAGEIRYTNGVLSLDLDGDRRADFEIGFAQNTKISTSSLLF